MTCQAASEWQSWQSQSFAPWARVLSSLLPCAAVGPMDGDGGQGAGGVSGPYLPQL